VPRSRAGLAGEGPDAEQRADAGRGPTPSTADPEREPDAEHRPDAGRGPTPSTADPEREPDAEQG
jgi:hypothetical protein